MFDRPRVRPEAGGQEQAQEHGRLMREPPLTSAFVTENGTRVTRRAERRL